MFEKTSTSQQEPSVTLKFPRSVFSRQVEDTALQGGDNQSLFRLEVTTHDYYYFDSPWQLFNVISGTVVLERFSFVGTGGGLLIDEECLESRHLCYHFIFTDRAEDGLSRLPNLYKKNMTTKSSRKEVTLGIKTNQTYYSVMDAHCSYMETMNVAFVLKSPLTNIITRPHGNS